MITKFENKKMNPRIKKLWVDTLRSNTVKQGFETLCFLETKTNEYKFCCLGVLCEIYNSEMKRLHKKQLKIDIYYTNNSKTVYSYNNESGSLPIEVQEWSGLYTSCGSFKDISWASSKDTSLAHLNDAGVSFEKIAQIIEKEF